MVLTDNEKRLPAGGFLGYVLRRYWGDEALDMASSLAYTSLLSMVPLLAIVLALLAAFPGFETMRRELLEALFRDLVPQVGEQVEIYVGRFAANAGRLTLFGLAGLVATAVMLLVAIEAALNRIFRVPHLRAPWSRLVVYWGALTVGPLLAGVSLTMTGWFSLLPWVRSMHHWAGREATADLRDVLGAVTPLAIMTVAFTILFLVAPNRRVRPADAASGAVVSAFLLLALRKGFELYVTLWSAYRPVYGAMAAVPIFLAWVYLSWAAVLFGAEIAAALPERRRGRLDGSGPLPPRRQLTLALVALEALLDEAGQAANGLGVEALAELTREGERPVVETLRRLAAAGLVRRLPGNRFACGEAFDRATLADLLRTLELGLVALEQGEAASEFARVEALIAGAARAQGASLRFPLRELVEGRAKSA